MRTKNLIMAVGALLTTTGIAEEIRQATVSPRSEEWQWSGVELSKNQKATIRCIADNKYITHYYNGGPVGSPNGNGVTAGDHYLFPGFKEGCVVVRCNGKVMHFGDDMVVDGPGSIAFITNDVPPNSKVPGLLKDLSQIEGPGGVKIPLDKIWKAVKGSGNGYTDNSGNVVMRITITDKK